MSPQSFEESLKTAYQKLKESEEKKSSKTSFEGFTEEDKYVIQEHTVCRILDFPVLCSYSYIKGDDGKLKLFKFPSVDEDPNFILYKIMDKVLESTYEGKTADGKHKFTQKVKDENPEIYKMIVNNGNDAEGEYGPNGWGKWRKRGSGKWGSTASNTSCFMNVINRKPFKVEITKNNDKGEEVTTVKEYSKDWCYENKHSLLLARGYKSFGAPITIYNILLKEIYTNYGNFRNFDVYIHKLKNDPYYSVANAEQVINNLDAFPYAVKGNLTEKEETMALYDLKEIAKPTSYLYIYQNLKESISKIDKALGTSFMDELLRAVENEDPKAATSSLKDASLPFDDKKEEAPVSKPRASSSSATASTVTTEGISKLFYVENGKSLYDSLPEDQKKLIVGVEADKPVFGTKDLSSCPKCRKDQPTIISERCLFCGEKF